MQRMLTVLSSIAVTVFGLTAANSAQAEPTSPSPAQQLGVQELSIQNNFRPAPNPAPVSDRRLAAPTVENGLVLYRIDRSTRVLVGPVRGNDTTFDFAGQTQQGDNRLQLLRDLEQ